MRFVEYFRTQPNNFLSIVVCLVLLVIGLKYTTYLRGIGYDIIPDNNVILDERTWNWMGLSVRDTGVPAGWSGLSYYLKGWEQTESYKKKAGVDIENFNVVVNNVKPNIFTYLDYPKPVTSVKTADFGQGDQYVLFVQPFLEQPPLGAIILSSFVPSSTNGFLELVPLDFRRSSQYLAVATSVLIFILGWQIFRNPIIGLIAAMIYGSAPSYLLLSRYALLENAMSPLLLLAVNLLVWARSHNIKVIAFAGFIMGFVALTKVTGYPMILVGAILLKFYKFGNREIMVFLIPALIVGSLYFFWAMYLAPNVFWEVVYTEGLKRGFVGPINVLATILKVGIINFPVDGWWTGGFLSLVLLTFKKEHLPIYVFSAGILLTVLLFGGANYPWYYIPLVPFLCLATAYLIWKAAAEPNFLSVIIFFLIFFSSSMFWGYGVYQADLESTRHQQPFAMYRLVLLLFVGSALWWSLKKNFTRLNTVWFIFMVFIIALAFKWNAQSIFYILSHWGKLPSIYAPGTLM